MGTSADDSRPDRAAHYSDASPDVESAAHPVDVILPDLSLRLTADRGVFAADRLDAGTKLLLLEAPPIEPGESRLLDLGCGWGAIACVTAVRAPHARIWAVDVNERARHLTAQNAETSKIAGRVVVAAPDDVADDVRFDRILSNPPIRIGKAALHELLTTWLDRLAPTGRAHLVVNRHLGSDSLARWLADKGHGVDRLKSRAGYRLLEVSPAPADVSDGGRP